MATMNVSVSSHTFISNKDQSADHSSMSNLRTQANFYWGAKNNFENWDAASSHYYYFECAVLRFERPAALRYSRITSAVLHFVCDGAVNAGSGWESKAEDKFYYATYNTSRAASAISWQNFRDAIVSEWTQIGNGSVKSTPVSHDVSLTSLYNGDLSASEFTIAICGGYQNISNVGSQGSNYIDPSASYLTLTYEPATQPAPTPLYPKDQTLIESNSTLFSWQFNGDTAAVQQAAELQYKNVNDADYTTISLTQATPSYLLQETLPAGSYQWRVKVTNDAGTSSDYSAVATFNIIGRPASPIINEPENKTLTEITWNAVDQQSCEIILADQSGTELFRETRATTEGSYRPNFFLNGNYLFSVRVMNASAMWSDWAQRAFTISAAGPEMATISLIASAGDPAINLSISIPSNVQAVLMRSSGGDEKIIAHLDEYGETYRDNTVAANVEYLYWIRTYDAGYTDTDSITASISFDGVIIEGKTSAINLHLSDEKFLPHSEDISREYAIMKFTGREFPMIERSEFTTVEISRRFYVSAEEKKTLDALYKDDGLFYRDTKENAFPVAITSIHYESFMADGYLGTLSFVRLNEKEVVINV